MKLLPLVLLAALWWFDRLDLRLFVRTTLLLWGVALLSDYGTSEWPGVVGVVLLALFAYQEDR